MEASAEGITLYWAIGSQPSRAVKALLLAGNIPHKEVSIDIMKGEQKGEEYTRINPRQLVPYIKDGDFGLSESNAILKYLCNTYDTIPEHFFPKKLQDRYRVDQFLEYHQFHFRPAILGPLRSKLGTKLRGMEIPQDVLDLQEQQFT
jgi:glutathione S-transferase